MRKRILVGVLLSISLTVIGCSELNNEVKTEDIVKGDNHQATINVNQEDRIPKNKAIVRAVEFHNDLNGINSDYNFPETINETDEIVQNVGIGGKSPGNTVKLEMTVETQKDGNNILVTLKKDYNITVNGIKAISYWTYEVSDNGVRLLNKNESGNLVKIIK